MNKIVLEVFSKRLEGYILKELIRDKINQKMIQNTD
jgi:hypothetical protein